MNKEVILTGLRSNSEFHLGNYLGAILPMVDLQKKYAGQYQLNMFIPDLHSFTTPIDHNNLYEQTLKNLKVFVAAGLNIEDQYTFIYRQSYIPAHSEMTWLLSCFSYYGELRRMTQFKEKGHAPIQRTEESVSTPVSQRPEPDSNSDIMNSPSQDEPVRDVITAGLYLYPVLMAADILLYGGKWIPVGDDQRQHVEFTRNLALRMNNKFGDLFVVPEDNVKQAEFTRRTEPIRIRSLRNPEKKMSKSVEDPAGTILLSDKPEEAAQKVMSATTDSLGTVRYDWDKQPGISNLLQILQLLTNRPQSEVIKQWDGKSSYGELKTTVAEAVNNFLSKFQSRLASVDDKKLLQKLEADEEAMSTAANTTLLRVQQALGLRLKN
ncbi:tryptophan--tRNA ligase [Candidatus Saccharibacteria bacterium]|nr:tryptophan--tRNA ligase [Candidatus Saccharibacteria bacterium]